MEGTESLACVRVCVCVRACVRAFVCVYVFMCLARFVCAIVYSSDTLLTTYPLTQADAPKAERWQPKGLNTHKQLKRRP